MARRSASFHHQVFFVKLRRRHRLPFAAVRDFCFGKTASHTLQEVFPGEVERRSARCCSNISPPPSSPGSVNLPPSHLSPLLMCKRRGERALGMQEGLSPLIPPCWDGHLIFGVLKSRGWGKDQRTEARPKVTAWLHAGAQWLSGAVIPIPGSWKTSRPDVVREVHRMKDSLMSELRTPVEYNRKINSKWRWKSFSRVLLSTKKTNWLLQWFQPYVNGAFLKATVQGWGEKPPRKSHQPLHANGMCVHRWGKRERHLGLNIFGSVHVDLCMRWGVPWFYVHACILFWTFRLRWVWSVFSHPW